MAAPFKAFPVFIEHSNVFLLNLYPIYTCMLTKSHFFSKSGSMYPLHKCNETLLMSEMYILEEEKKNWSRVIGFLSSSAPKKINTKKVFKLNILKTILLP